MINRHSTPSATTLRNLTMLEWLSYSILWLGFLIIVTPVKADDNPYAIHYHEQNPNHLRSLASKPDPKIMVGRHMDEDNISMLEEGYDMMGTSRFQSTVVSPDLALAHARTIHADMVLVYHKPGAAKTPGSKMELIKEALKSGKSLTEKDMQEEPETFRYYASYWAKMPPPALGVHIIKLTPKEKDDQGQVSNPIHGLRVLAVIKGSPAEKAGVKRGDQLLAINNVPLEKPEDLTGYISKHRGEEVQLLISENEVERTEKVLLQ